MIFGSGITRHGSKRLGQFFLLKSFRSHFAPIVTNRDPLNLERLVTFGHDGGGLV